jgi:exopolysaccharide production protein ExoQ
VNEEVDTTERDRLRPWEKALLGFAIFLAASAVFPIIHSSQSADPSGRDQLTEHLWWAVYAVLLIVMVPWYSRMRDLALRMPLLLLLVAWAVASVTWSDAPALSVRRVAALLLTTLLGLYLALRLSRRQFIDLFSVGLGVMSLLSLMTAVALPRYGLDHLRGDAWRGVFATKNGLGRIACLTLVIWFYRARAYKTSLALVVPISLVAGLDLYYSDSRTSLAIFLFLTLFIAAAPMLQGDFRIATSATMFLLIAGGSLGLWMYAHSGNVLSSVGASSTLTGRTSIWSAAWYMAQQHYWFGYGYNAFWTGGSGPAGVLWGIVGSQPPHAHNGFLDTWLDLGAIGVALLVVFLLWASLRAWLSMRSGAPDAVWSLVFLVFLLAYNFSESSFLSRNSIFWIMFVLAAAWVAPQGATALSWQESDLRLSRSASTGGMG